MQMTCCCQSCFTEVSHSWVELRVNPVCVCILLWLQEVCTVGRWWSGTPVELKTLSWFRAGCQQTAIESLFITWVHQQPHRCYIMLVYVIPLCRFSVQVPELKQSGLLFLVHWWSILFLLLSHCRGEWSRTSVFNCDYVSAGWVGSPAEKKRIWGVECMFRREGSAVDSGLRPGEARPECCLCFSATAGSPQQQQLQGEPQKCIF